MNTLSEISKTKILQSLPQHFIDDNIEDLIRKLDEINNKWSIYQWTSFEDGFDGFSLIADSCSIYNIRDTFTEFYKSCYLDNKRYIDFDQVLTSFKNQRFVPQTATVEDIQNLDYLGDNIILEPSIDYKLNINGTFVYISCHQQFLKTTFELAAKKS